MTAAKGLPLELEAIKQHLSLARPQQVVAPIATGSPPIDDLLQGGLPRGRVVEVAGAWSSGKTALLFGVLAGLTTSGRLCAYVDGRGELYPPSMAAMGVELDRLLVVAPPRTGKAIARAAEIVARSGAFALVVLDLPDGARLDDTASGRLRSAAAAGGASVVALAPEAGSVSQASLKLEIAADRSFHQGPGAAALGARGARLVTRRRP